MLRKITTLLLGFLLVLPFTVDAAEGGRRKTAQILTFENDANGICEDQTTAGATALDLDGASVTGGVAVISATPLTKVAQQISIEGTGDNSGVIFTIVGTDADGYAETEALTGANNGTAESARWYSTITSITPDGAVDGNVEVGWLSASGGVTETLVPDLNGFSPAMSIAVDVSGTISYSIEHTSGNMPSSIEPLWFNTLDLTTKTADAEGNIVVAVGGVRANVTSCTTCTLNLMIFQGELGDR